MDNERLTEKEKELIQTCNEDVEGFLQAWVELGSDPGGLILSNITRKITDKEKE